MSHVTDALPHIASHCEACTFRCQYAVALRTSDTGHHVFDSALRFAEYSLEHLEQVQSFSSCEQCSMVRSGSHYVWA